MITRRIIQSAAALVVASLVVAALPNGAAAQADLSARGAPLAQRIAAVKDGTVRLTFAVRSDVCGWSNGISTRRDRSRNTFSGDRGYRRDVEWDDDCQEGPGRLAVDVRGGEPTAIRFYVGGRWRPAASDVTDIGAVPVAQAAGFLLGLAERDRGRVAHEAIVPTAKAAAIST